jgi:2-phosphosulfolactate phosphatase
MRVDVCVLPPAPGSVPLEGRTCLVVDVLRATSSIAMLLDGGFEAVYPAGSISEGRARRTQLEAALGRRVLLCGEEHALPPEDYDLGNSPTELGRVREAEPAMREAVVATSNGTKALLACRDASLVLAAAPLNASVLTALALAAGDDVLVVCSGTNGERSRDDELAAGLLVQRLVSEGAQPTEEARAFLDRYEAVADDLAGAFRETRHGQTLIDLGFAVDIDLCTTADRVTVAGVLRIEDGLPVLRRSDEGPTGA